MSVFFIVCSLLCFIYYIIIILYAGMGAAFSAFWLFAGGGSLFLGTIFLYRKQNPGVIQFPLWLKVAVITLCITGLFIFIVVEIFISANMLSDTEQDLEYIIVLGAQVKGETVSNSLKLRLDKAIEYLEAHEDTIVIVSGGKGPGELITEAEAMQRYLVERGIPQTRIRKEDKSTSTVENLKFSKLYTGESRSVGIITSDFHMFRGKAIAYQQGYESIVGIAAKSDPVLKLNLMIRECFAVLKDKFMGNI